MKTFFSLLAVIIIFGAGFLTGKFEPTHVVAKSERWLHVSFCYERPNGGMGFGDAQFRVPQDFNGDSAIIRSHLPVTNGMSVTPPTILFVSESHR